MTQAQYAEMMFTNGCVNGAVAFVRNWQAWSAEGFAGFSDGSAVYVGQGEFRTASNAEIAVYQ